MADDICMSGFGLPGVNPAMQAAQAQLNEARWRAAGRLRTESARRFDDVVDLRVAGVESDTAARAVSDGDDDPSSQRDQPSKHQAKRGEMHAEPGVSTDAETRQNLPLADATGEQESPPTGPAPISSDPMGPHPLGADQSPHIDLTA